MKKLYLFVLGRDPELAKLEIDAVLDRLIGGKYKILGGDNSIEVVEIDEEFKVEWIEEFGGVIKVAEVLANSSKAEILEKELGKNELYMGTSNKVTYFLDEYDNNISEFVESYLKSYFKEIKVKASVKKESYPSRLIKKNTLKEGLEIVLFRNYVARTISVANPILLKERDLGRPRTDYLKTISLRLAKILINLSCVDKGELLLDPFCGSGGILQEAVLKGINVIGLDTDKNAIQESKLNMEWLSGRYKFSGKWKVEKGDATKMSSFVKKCDGVATEPYLGPYIRKTPNLFQAKTIIAELREMYIKLLSEANSVVKSGGKIAIIVPKFRTSEGKVVSMDFAGVAEASGFRIVSGPVFYAYKESKILREIYVLENS